MKLKAGLLLNAVLCICPLTFITEALHLVLGISSVVSTTLPWQAFMTCCVTKAMPIHFIDNKCHIKQLKSGKSRKTWLTNHTWSISHHWSQGQGHTHIHTYQRMNKSNFKKPGVPACGRHTPGVVCLNISDHVWTLVRPDLVAKCYCVVSIYKHYLVFIGIHSNSHCRIRIVNGVQLFLSQLLFLSKV